MRKDNNDVVDKGSHGRKRTQKGLESEERTIQSLFKTARSSS